MSTVDVESLYKDFKSRYAKYTMRGRLLKGPIEKEVCLHNKLDERKFIRKFVTAYQIDKEAGVNWCLECHKPLANLVQECQGCYDFFWGLIGDGYFGCIECERYM